MRLNADLSLAASVDSKTLPWVPSPLPGVERRMLERDGDEVVRATSLVRYAPGSAFAPHTHGSGEEFLVLEGVFSDETGDFGAGFYVRNPPGSRHTPRSRPGATILVKLRQMPAQEIDFVRVDTRDTSLWQSHGEGLQQLTLFDQPWERVVMQRMAAGFSSAAETWVHGVEFYVLDGSIQIDGQTLAAGNWSRYPAGSALAVASEHGALLYRKSGHLG